ncbi:hypothetical protein LPB90_18295 [Chryseobacterium sp. LC2016-29]|uniref:hypothetical protein n=1 Tax=Chryseobacterium sp. LC2016-29 TaxID=2897331 RepID=UPI001E54D0D3|nr:hypothetical protein [Chryseobacterium sp. LC2016-29]MCD0480393.1 hypothetical protein [Chryseobacterium sp. LC2016-29]
MEKTKLEQIFTSGGIKTSQIDRIFDIINTSNKNIFLSCWHDRYKEYISKAYQSQYPCLMVPEDENKLFDNPFKKNEIVLPSLEIELNKFITDPAKLVELIAIQLNCSNIEYKKAERVQDTLKDLQVKKLFVINASFLSDMQYWDLSYQEILVPNKNNTEFYNPDNNKLTYNYIDQIIFKNYEYFENLRQNFGIVTVFMGFRGRNLRGSKLKIRNLKSEPRTTLKDYTVIFKLVKENISLDFAKDDFTRIKTYCVKHKLNVHDILATFTKTEEVSLVANTGFINFQTFINCFERYVFNLRSDNWTSTFLEYKS